MFKEHTRRALKARFILRLNVSIQERDPFTFFLTTSDIFPTLFRVIKKKVYEEMKIAFCERVFSGNLIFRNSCHDTSSSGGLIKTLEVY